jgi:hypothetical protein
VAIVNGATVTVDQIFEKENYSGGVRDFTQNTSVGEKQKRTFASESYFPLHDKDP